MEDAALRRPKCESIIERTWILVLEFDRPSGAAVECLVNTEISRVIPNRHQIRDARAETLHIAKLQSFSAGYDASRHNGHVRLEGLQGRAAAVNRLAMEGGIVLDEITQVRSNLEETFLAITDGGER